MQNRLVDPPSYDLRQESREPCSSLLNAGTNFEPFFSTPRHGLNLYDYKASGFKGDVNPLDIIRHEDSVWEGHDQNVSSQMTIVPTHFTITVFFRGDLTLFTNAVPYGRGFQY